MQNFRSFEKFTTLILSEQNFDRFTWNQYLLPTTEFIPCIHKKRIPGNNVYYDLITYKYENLFIYVYQNKKTYLCSKE